MFKYLINGELFEFSTEGQRDNILAQAKERGFSIELVEEEVATDFQTDSVEDVDAVSEIVTSEDTGLPLDDGSSAFQNNKPLESEDLEVVEGVSIMGENEEQRKIREAAEMAYMERVGTGLESGSLTLGEMFASIPETIYNISAIPQNIIAEVTGLDIGASADKFKDDYDIKNSILEHYEEESARLRKINESYDKANYAELGVVNSIAAGNYGDAFAQLGTGLAESAPVSLSMMVGGAYTSIGRLSAASTVAFAGPEIKEFQENNPEMRILEATVKGLASAGAESVFGAISSKAMSQMYKDIIKREGKEQGTKIFKNGLTNMYSNALKKFGAPAGMVGEGIEEVATTISQNMLKGRPPLENALESFVQGVGGGALYGSPANIATAARGVKEGLATIKVNKKLKESEYNDLKDAFNLESGVNQSIIDLVEVDGALKIIENKTKKQVKKDEITQEEANDIVNNFNEIHTATRQTKAAKIEKEFQPGIIDNLAKKNKLVKQIKQVGDAALSAPLVEEVKLLNASIEKEMLGSREVSSKNLLGKAKAIAEQIGTLSIEESNSAEQTENIVARIHAEDDKAGVNRRVIDSDGYGFFYTNSNGQKSVVLNNHEIISDGAINTAAHEVLHHALDSMFKNSKDASGEMIEVADALNQFKKRLKKDKNIIFDNKILEQRLEQYAEKYAEKIAAADMKGDTEASNKAKADLAEEELVLLSEAMLDGDIIYNQSFGSDLMDFVRRLLSSLGVKAKIKTGEDAFNFLKDYNRSIKKGKLSKGQVKTFKKGTRKGGLISSDKKSDSKKSSDVKQSMSKKMQNLVDRQEAIGFMEGSMDAAELDLMKEEVKQEINELRAKEGIKPKAVTKTGSKAPMTLEEADEAYEDAVEAWNEAPDNMALEAEVEKALRNVEAAKQIFDAGEEIAVEPKAETKPVEKAVREKKDRSTKRYTLTDEAKAKIEPLIEKAQAMNKELIAKEKKLNDDKIASIRSTPETVMSRTEQADAVLQAKANPIRLPKPVELRRIETEIRDRLEKPMGKAITFFTKLLYDRIPKEAANVIGGRDAYKSAAEARILSIVINEFKKETINRQGEKTTNDIEDIIFNRGGLRLLTLATDLGVVDSSQGIAGTLEEGKIGDYGDWDKAFDEGPVKMDVDGMFRVSSLLGDSGRMAEAMEQVAEFWKDNIGNSPIENFKKLPSLVDDIVADMLNISRNVLTARSGNLNKDDYNNALKGITKPYAVYKVEGKDVRVSPEFAEELENRLRNEGKSFERFADQNILQTLFKFLPKLSADDYRYADRTKGRYSGKATGVPKNLVKLTYSGLERGTTGMGNMKARVSKVAYKDVLAALGGFVNADGVTTKLGNASGRTSEGQTLLGVIKLMNRMITNDISRNSNIGLDPMTVQDIAAGKNDLMMSMKRPMKRSIQVPNVELQKILDKYYEENPNSSFIQQVNGVLDQLVGYDSTLRGFFKYHAKQYALDNKVATTEDVAKQFSAAWGKFHKYIEQEVSFKAAIDEISTGTPTQASLENFFVLYARSMKNKKYQGASNNKLLWNLVSSNIKNSENQPQSQKEGSKMLNDLGFSLRIPLNKNGKEGSRSYIDVTKTIKDKNGNDKTVTEPISSPLSIEKIKSLAKPKGVKLNVNDIKTIGDQTVKDSIRYINLVMDHLDRLIRSGQTQRAIADIYTMGLGQLTPIRKIATLGTVYKFKGEGILEHADSVFLMQEKLREYVANEKRDRTSLEKYLDKQRVNVIPKTADPKQKVGTAKEKYSEAKVKEILRPLEKHAYSKGAGKKRIDEKVKAENALASMKKAMDRTADTKRKGISVLDFDDTLARTNSNVLYTMPNGTTGKLTAEQFAKDGDRLAAEGAEWDFSEFSKVVDGKKGPLFEKTKELVSKFGNENVFVLTARPANSKFAIHEFLSGLGLDIPLQNITGLADSSPQAKGDWITGKAAEGYNDFFFADDHVKNVVAVDKALKKAKVKSKTVVADPNIKYSLKTKGQPKLIKDLVDVFDMDGEGQSLLDKATRMLDLQWNELYKDVTGVDPNIEFGDVEAQKLGDEVSKSTISRIRAITRGYLVESGADDFLGLLYRTLPKGKKGEAMMRLYEDNLLKPFAIASREVEKARIKMAKRYRDIKTNNGISDKVLNGKLTLKTESGKDVTYTSEDAVRVYMWRKQGIEVPGLSEENELDLAEHVKSSDELYSFALNLMNNTLPDEFADPKKNWVTGSLKTDYLEGINNTQRKDALRFWEKGVEAIFSESNMKKLKAQHGSKFTDALSNSLERMRTGRNTMQGLDSDTKIMLQFISGAVGNIMFLNTRSAGLQLLSATNFMEAGDNTWGKSLKTIFTKMPTLAKDYKMLMDTDFLLDRRNALKMDVNDSDIARIAQGKGIQGKLARFLQWGYVFTQAADSRAIALGGAVYYRNAYDSLIEQGIDPKIAKEQALLETTEHAQSSQQSSRADKISKQQASTSGRLMLAFANTPMQYNRIVQKSYLDLVNNRGSKRKNLYNIAYYGLAQNLLFTVAQGAMLTAVYGTLFGDDEDEKLTYDQQVGVANGVLSSWLRGMGIWGNGLNALKQTFMNVHKESKKKRPQYDVAAIKGLTSIMPAVGSKISKIYATTRAFEYNKDFLFDVNEGNVFKNYAKMPGVIALGQTAALFNVPLDRVQRKTANLIDAVNYAQSDLTTTAGLLFGHSLWTLQSNEEKEADYEEQKQRRKGIKKGNKIKEEKSKLTPEELKFSDLKDLKKQQQIDSLTKYGLSKKQIRLLKYEKDRIEAIIKLQNKKRKNSLK